MKKTLYITQETQDRLAKLGGPTPSESLRRAVALAECADELAEALEKLLERYTELVNCGDCGNWNPESEVEVINSRHALSKAYGDSQ